MWSQLSKFRDQPRMLTCPNLYPVGYLGCSVLPLQDFNDFRKDRGWDNEPKKTASHVSHNGDNNNKKTRNREIQSLVTDRPVEFEK